MLPRCSCNALPDISTLQPCCANAVHLAGTVQM
uniref:Uncharacterized protein n=1 Tax=Anguilla anguilla TaxID=7936 RepID=A0A0E9SCK2_ANGAN